MSMDIVCMLYILGMQFYHLRVSICTLDGERLHVCAVFNKSALDERDSWCRGVIGSIGHIQNVGFC